ncbi:MAG: winged helix-turn-helix transcriptional regulator [Patescibacteria group bacterium]
MLSLSYTKSTTLQDTLARIDALRMEILTTPLTVKTEERRIFRSSILAIYTSLLLNEFPLTIDEIISILTTSKRFTSPTSIAVVSYHNALVWIRQHWTGNREPVTAGDLQVLATILFTKPSHIDRVFIQNSQDIESLTMYLSKLSDHPVIQAGLAHAYLLAYPMGQSDNGIFARTVQTLILSQYGYTLRGMATHTIDADDVKAFTFAKETIKKYGQCTQWLEYSAATIEKTYKRLYLSLIKESHAGVKGDIINRASELSRREEDIMALLIAPTGKITNRQIQRRFHISSITASRHLKKLSNIGFLSIRGKGRSVYYMRT